MVSIHGYDFYELWVAICQVDPETKQQWGTEHSRNCGVLQNRWWLLCLGRLSTLSLCPFWTGVQSMLTCTTVYLKSSRPDAWPAPGLPKGRFSCTHSLTTSLRVSALTRCGTATTDFFAFSRVQRVLQSSSLFSLHGDLYPLGDWCLFPHIQKQLQ